MIFLSALALYLFALLVFLLLSAVIVFHLNRYAVSGDQTRLARRIFWTGNALFFAASLFTFLRIHWENFLFG